MSTSPKFWNKAAAGYAKRPIDNIESYEHTLSRTRSYLNSGQRVLEIGCGTGSTALLLAHEVEHFTAADYSSEMINIGIEKAQNQGVTNLEFLNADVFDDRLVTGGYDVVMAHNLLHLLENIPQTIARVSELLKPEGVFISKTPCIADRMAYMIPLITVMRWIGKAPYVDSLKSSHLESMIEDENFEIVEASSFSQKAISRYIVAKKKH